MSFSTPLKEPFNMIRISQYGTRTKVEHIRKRYHLWLISIAIIMSERVASLVFMVRWGSSSNIINHTFLTIYIWQASRCLAIPIIETPVTSHGSRTVRNLGRCTPPLWDPYPPWISVNVWYLKSQWQWYVSHKLVYTIFIGFWFAYFLLSLRS